MSRNQVSVGGEVLRLSAFQLVRVALARFHARVGWPGGLGVALLLSAVAVLAWLMYEGGHHLQLQRDAVQETARAEAMLAAKPLPPLAHILPPALPRGVDIAKVLKRIEVTVQASGLAWPQADYRLTPLNDEGLATLEIHTTLKGPYPKLRKLIATLLDGEPALALRALNLTRPNGDTSEIEAKVRLVVFLADGWLASDPGVAR